MKLFDQFGPSKWSSLPPTSSLFAMISQTPLHDDRTRFFFQQSVDEMLLLTDWEAQDFAVEVINRAFEGAAATSGFSGGGGSLSGFLSGGASAGGLGLGQGGFVPTGDRGFFSRAFGR